MSKSLFLDLYELTMAQVYFKYKRNSSAIFELFIRSNSRPFYIACGIDEVLNYLENLDFTDEDIDYLKSLGIFEDDFLQYLKEFKFKGDIWALDEPEIIFAGEPIIYVVGNLIEAQIVESVLLNKINLATTLATKAFRVVLSAKGKDVYDFSLRRTQGLEASEAIAKYSYIVGVKGTSNVYAGFLYKIPVVGTMSHSFVMSFDREIDAFLAFAKTFPEKTILLVDTYDTYKGIDSAIQVAKFLKKEGCELFGIRIDSGNLVADSKYARQLLDKEGLVDAIILASGNLDEFKIEKIIEEKAPIDAFGVGTNMGCSSDLPYTDVIYKLVEIKEKTKDFTPTMKLSKDKITFPAKKEIIRNFKAGIMQNDIVVLDEESTKKDKKLMQKLMEGGIRLQKEKDIKEKRRIFLEKAKALPDYLKKSKAQSEYPVIMSKKILALVDKLKVRIERNMPNKIIFIDIDTQNDFLNKKGLLYVNGANLIIDNIKKLTKFAERNNIFIISSQDTHKKDDPEFKDFPRHCVRGSWGYKKITGTVLAKNKVITFKKVYTEEEIRNIIFEFNQVILEKNVLDIFSNPNTFNILEEIQPDKIYIYGVVVEYCVKEAIEGILKANFKISIVEDAVKEISPKEKDKLFSLWKKKGVEFITTTELLQSLPTHTKK